MIDYSTLIASAAKSELNIIAYSNNPEHLITDDLVESFRSCGERVTHFDLQVFQCIDLFKSPDPNSDFYEVPFPQYVLAARVFCFSNLDFANDEMLDVIEELMKSRTLRGIPLPNLRSVIVTHGSIDSADNIVHLQGIAPSIVIGFS